MIQANELRIGNFVYGINEYQETALPICSLHSDNTIRLQVGNTSIGCFYAEEIDPIPLTEEWLVKFGCKKANQYNMFLDCGHIKMYFRFNGDLLHIIVGTLFLPNQIKYVHQLQNLYFALTGEELKLKTN